jgi:hypothetical protein
MLRYRYDLRHDLTEDNKNSERDCERWKSWNNEELEILHSDGAAAKGTLPGRGGSDTLGDGAAGVSSVIEETEGETGGGYSEELRREARYEEEPSAASRRATGGEIGAEMGAEGDRASVEIGGSDPRVLESVEPRRNWLPDSDL